MFVVISVVRSIMVTIFLLEGATNMHKKMVKKVLRTYIVFFDSNPVGRVITRFSKDLVAIDLIMAMLVTMITIGVFRAISVAISIAILEPWLLIAVFICLIVLYYYMIMGSPSMVETQRLDGIYRGPIH